MCQVFSVHIFCKLPMFMTGQLVPNSTNMYSEIPQILPRHFAKINQHITILESFQEFITKKTAGGSKVLHFFTLWVRKQSIMELSLHL